MRDLLIVLFPMALALVLITETSAQEATVAHKDSLKQAVELYYSLNLKIFQPNSTKEDVDDLFHLFTDDFVYVHPKYGGEYSRKDIYDGYLHNQNNGSYNGSIVDVKIKNMIIGLNGLTTERAYVSKTESGELEEVDAGMTLFEFNQGKISKIFEYW